MATVSVTLANVRSDGSRIGIDMEIGTSVWRVQPVVIEMHETNAIITISVCAIKLFANRKLLTLAQPVYEIFERLCVCFFVYHSNVIVTVVG